MPENHEELLAALDVEAQQKTQRRLQRPKLLKNQELGTRLVRDFDFFLASGLVSGFWFAVLWHSRDDSMPRFNLTPGHSSCASKVWTSCWVVARICRGPDSGPRLIRHEADGLAGSFRNLHPIKLLFVLWHLKWWDARGRGQGIEEGGIV